MDVTGKIFKTLSGTQIISKFEEVCLLLKKSIQQFYYKNMNMS